MKKLLILTILLTAGPAFCYDHDPLGLDRVDNVQRIKRETYQNLNVSQRQSQSFLMNNMNNNMSDTYRQVESSRTDVDRQYSNWHNQDYFGGY